MTSYLYLVPLPKPTVVEPSQRQARQRVVGSGKIQDAGFVSENVALANVDLTIRGNINYAEFAKKVAREMRSLSESNYEAVPLADDANLDADDQKAYYNIQDRNVEPAHDTTELAYQYRLSLQEKATKRTHWRAVATNSESINTGLATGSGGQIGIPTEASKVRWFTTAGGTENASVQSTANAEYGDVDLYDPTNASNDDPTLIYELAFDREGPVDVRVWDDVGSPGSKFVTYDSTDITQWVHAYHPAFDFEGDPIIDNGLIRVRFDSANSQIDADEWNDGTTSWDDLSTVGGSGADYELFDVDLEAYGPAEVRAFAEWQDTGDDSIHATVLKVQRGLDRVVMRQPDNGTIPSDLETMLDPIVNDNTTDKNPNQTVESKGEVK